MPNLIRNGTSNAQFSPTMRTTKQSRRRPSETHAAFTSTDLLVALAVLMLIGAIEWKALANGRGQSRTAICLANLHVFGRATTQYAGDHNGYLPPNSDQGNAYAWALGSMNNASDATNTAKLVGRTNSALGIYVGHAEFYRCPEDTSMASNVPRIRSYSLSQAVGTIDGIKPVDAPWLDGNHTHTANHPWRTYATLDSIVAPDPAHLFWFIDEDADSINDAGIAVAMTDGANTQMIDWPATRHAFAGGISFADEHAEMHRWADPRTPVRNHIVTRVTQPYNADITWLQQRTSAKAN